MYQLHILNKLALQVATVKKQQHKNDLVYNIQD